VGCFAFGLKWSSFGGIGGTTTDTATKKKEQERSIDIDLVCTRFFTVQQLREK
jgi:hypothetical protein